MSDESTSMDEDTTQAAWHQVELEEAQRLLENDPEYDKWTNGLMTTTANQTLLKKGSIG